ncbi:MAG: discoidin domain-containing protein [Planctomycetes bacterium]|nr:discoidin domain-containing protein [Planctomycetota bacterium]
MNFRGRTNAYSLNSNTALPEAEWTHIAITFEVSAMGNNQKIYLNGKLDAEKRTTTPLSKSTADLLLGADGNGSTRWHWQGMLDDINIYNRALTADEVQLVMNLGTLGSPQKATNPHPADGQTDVARDAILTWTPGDSVQASQGHKLFLSTSFADVNDGSPAALLGVHDANAYAEAAKLPLEFGQTYYWRVDEIKNGDPNSPWKGSVWSFTTEPYAYPIAGAKITATASSQAAGTGPEKTIDGSGLTGGLHGTDPTTMWLSAGVLPNWIQYQFDKVYRVYELKVWNSNQLVEAALGYSAKKVTIETSPDGTTWTPVANVPEFAQGTGAASYAANGTDTLSLWFRGYPTAFADKGNNAYTVSGGGTDIGGTGDQFRFVYKQLSGDGSITVRVDNQTNTNTAARAGVMIRGTLEAGSMHATLAVTPGSSITLLSRVGAGGATTATAVTAGLKAPYWVRVTRTGNSFKAEYSPDGKTWTQAGANLTLLLGNNVYVGLAVSSHDATQLGVAEFSNVATTGTVTGPWQVLAIGAAQPSNDPAALYLTAEDKAGKKKMVVHPNPSATTLMAWTEWRIPLGDLSSAGVNLAAVKKLTLGVGDRTNPKAGAAGMLYFDDIAYGHPIK